MITAFITRFVMQACVAEDRPLIAARLAPPFIASLRIALLILIEHALPLVNSSDCALVQQPILTNGSG
jgi:hypothetical protein